MIMLQSCIAYEHFSTAKVELHNVWIFLIPKPIFIIGNKSLDFLVLVVALMVATNKNVFFVHSLKKCHTFGLLQFQHTSADFDNFGRNLMRK